MFWWTPFHANREIFEEVLLVRFGSVADPHDTLKAAVRAAGMGGIADLAIHQKQPFTSGKYWELLWELERKVLADSAI